MQSENPAAATTRFTTIHTDGLTLLGSSCLEGVVSRVLPVEQPFEAGVGADTCVFADAAQHPVRVSDAVQHARRRRRRDRGAVSLWQLHRNRAPEVLVGGLVLTLQPSSASAATYSSSETKFTTSAKVMFSSVLVSFDLSVNMFVLHSFYHVSAVMLILVLKDSLRSKSKSLFLSLSLQVLSLSWSL